MRGLRACGVAALLAATPVAAEDWRADARGDIAAAARILSENHPGFAGPDKARLEVLLAKAATRGRAAAESATDLPSYARALGRIAETFEDGHLALVAYGTIDEGPFHWPGFRTAWRGERMLVASSVDARIPGGAIVRSCDGEDSRTLMKRRLAATGFRAREAGQYWVHAPSLFIRAARQLPTAERRCRFVVNGKRQAIDLRWRPLSDRELENSVEGERTPIGLTEPRQGVFLLGMPTFSPDEDGVGRYRQMFAALEERRSELRKGRAIVVDLRGNGGGSSLWSRDAARLLWDRPAVEQRMADWFRGTSVEWRVSHGNIAYLRQILPYLEQQGQRDAVAEVGRLITVMEEARREGRSLVRLPAEIGAAAPEPSVESDLRTPVYLITDGGCASACLDAVDVFTRFANTRLIGAPTSADSQYLEVRNVELPSGKGRLMFAMKAWVNRKRPAGAVYVPDLPMLGLDWSTAAFLDRIEQDMRQPASDPRRRAPWWRPRER